jgi:hypothetical protein
MALTARGGEKEGASSVGRHEREREGTQREWVPPTHGPFLRHMGRSAKNGECGSVLRWRRLGELHCHFMTYFGISGLSWR